MADWAEKLGGGGAGATRCAVTPMERAVRESVDGAYGQEVWRTRGGGGDVAEVEGRAGDGRGNGNGNGIGDE